MKSGLRRQVSGIRLVDYISGLKPQSMTLKPKT